MSYFIRGDYKNDAEYIPAFYSGKPIALEMYKICSKSVEPANIGSPIFSSANIQPKLHISIGNE